MHRLGIAVDGVFAIGDDVFAAVAQAAFVGSGLSTDMLISHPGSTGAGIGFIDQAGENCLAVSLGANRLLSALDVGRASDAIERSDLVLATFESPDEPILAAFERARSRGVATLLNASPSRPILPQILARTTILVLNQVEADDLGLDGSGIAEGGDIDAARFAELTRAGLELVVVTLGERGAAAFRRDGTPLRQDAFPVDVVDTIGAGDAFAAGLAASLVEKRPVEEALRRAAACGALTAARFGALDAFPTRDALATFLSGNGPGQAGADL